MAARLSPADRDLARRVIAFYVARLRSEEGREQDIKISLTLVLMQAVGRPIIITFEPLRVR